MLSRRVLTVLNLAAAVAMVGAIYMALVQAPAAINLTETDRWAQRIIYFHVPTAWLSMLAFFVTFVAAILYLVRSQPRWDMLARCSAELGVAFTIAATASGSIWAKPAWNTWWTWDPRLTTYTIVLLLYIAYFMLRGAIEEPERRARFASVYSIFAFVSVPITFMSIRWWNTIHPVILDPNEDFGLGPGMTVAFVFCILAFTVLYVALLAHRLRLESTIERVAALRARLLT
jgi:heme exporter protein C